jgi:hypothetical protein
VSPQTKQNKTKLVTKGVNIKGIYYNRKTFPNVCGKAPKNIISPKLSEG